MSAHQALMVAAIREGTDLGTESATSTDTGSVNAGASASIVFQANGSVTFSQTGGSRSNTAPATNWNTNGGTYVSYELIQSDSAGDGSSGFNYANNSPFPSSTMYGENRYSMAAALTLNATGTATLNEGAGFGSGIISIKISVWDSASAGSRKAYGTYTVEADATLI
jgi:myosin-crossreactive antigen